VNFTTCNFESQWISENVILNHSEFTKFIVIQNYTENSLWFKDYIFFFDVHRHSKFHWHPSFQDFTKFTVIQDTQSSVKLYICIMTDFSFSVYIQLTNTHSQFYTCQDIFVTRNFVDEKFWQVWNWECVCWVFWDLLLIPEECVFLVFWGLLSFLSYKYIFLKIHIFKNTYSLFCLTSQKYTFSILVFWDLLSLLSYFSAILIGDVIA